MKELYSNNKVLIGWSDSGGFHETTTSLAKTVPYVFIGTVEKEDKKAFRLILGNLIIWVGKRT